MHDYNQRMDTTYDDIIDLDCGIAMNRITRWLDDELALPAVGDSWVYRENQHACTIQVRPLANRRIATLSLERTHLLAQGDATAIESFRKLFTLRFISAGG